MDCYNCEKTKLDENNVCQNCKLKLCSYCGDRMFDHYEDRMCENCDIDYCSVCYAYLSKGQNGLCRTCLARAAEEYIRNNSLN